MLTWFLLSPRLCACRLPSCFFLPTSHVCAHHTPLSYFTSTLFQLLLPGAPLSTPLTFKYSPQNPHERHLSDSCIYHRLADTLTHIASFFPHCFWLLAVTAIACLSCAILFACLSASLICLNTVVVHCHGFLTYITVINAMIYEPIGFAACAKQNGER